MRRRLYSKRKVKEYSVWMKFTFDMDGLDVKLRLSARDIVGKSFVCFSLWLIHAEQIQAALGNPYTFGHLKWNSHDSLSIWNGDINRGIKKTNKQ